jgi:TRAP-type mannitol/chloroaromatic compound transport system permease small subunit
MPDTPQATDELIAGRRGEAQRLPGDMPRWMAHAIAGIDRFSYRTGRVVSWLTVPLMAAMAYEIAARYLFTAPTAWAYDMSRMLYGALFVLGAGYALSRGVHIRSDFLYRNWSVRNQGRVDVVLYVVLYFPSMLVFLWVSTDWAWTSLSRAERGTDTAWMPLLGPIKSCLPLGIVFLLIQGVAELLKSLYAAQKGRWPYA